MQTESLLRERKKDTMSLWDKKSKRVNIMLLEKEGSLRDGLYLTAAVLVFSVHSEG